MFKYEKHFFLYINYLVLLLFLTNCKRSQLTMGNCDLISSIDIQIVYDSIVNRQWPLDLAIDTLSYLNMTAMKCSNTSEDSLLARMNDNLGKQLLKVNKLPDARKFFRTSLSLRKRMPQGQEEFNILRMYHNIGFAFLKEGEPHLALDYLDSADIWLPHENMRLVLVNTKLRKGDAYLEIGEYNNALRHLYVGLENYNLLDNPSQKLQVEIISSIVSCYRGLGNFYDAIQIAKSALGSSFGFDPHSKPNSREMADLYLDIGNVWQDSLLFDPDNEDVLNQAIWFTQEALNYYEEKQWHTQMTIAAGNLGELYRRIGHLRKAEKVLSNAIQRLSLFEEQQELFTQLYINRGETYYDQGKFENALNDYDSSLHFIMPAHKFQAKESIPPLHSHIVNHRHLMLLLSDIAYTYSTIHQQNTDQDNALPQAKVVYDTLFKLINMIRGDFISDHAKLELAAKSQDVLQRAFSICLQLANEFPEKRKYYEYQAFRISEQSKAFVLLETTRFNYVSSTLPTEKQEEEKVLLQKQIAIEKKIYTGGKSKAQDIKLKKELQDILDDIRIYQQTLKDDFPEIYAVKYKGADVSVKAIQNKILDQDQALIEYFIQDTALYIFVIKQNDFQLVEVPISRIELESKVSSFRKILEQDKFTDPSFEQRFIQSSNQLYDHLMRHIQPLLPKRLIIIPTGILNNLPFEALQYKTSQGNLDKQREDENFILFKHSISYCFSASLLNEMESTPKPKLIKSSPVIFASHFDYDLSKNKNNILYPPSLQNSLPFLRNLGINQEKEVNAIKKKFPKSEIYPKKNANKKAFRTACQKYPIIHVTTHGILNEEDPSFSFISFSQMTENLDLSELFFVKELYTERNWNLDLLFLSACQTASGKYFAGEGNISMASGLAQAGVRSFVTTYWNVPTSPKARIAPNFYEQLLRNQKPKDIALAEAKRLIAKSPESSPYDWAGLVLIGSTN